MESNDHIFKKNNLDKPNFRDTFKLLSQIPIKKKVPLLVTLLSRGEYKGSMTNSILV